MPHRYTLLFLVFPLVSLLTASYGLGQTIKTLLLILTDWNNSSWEWSGIVNFIVGIGLGAISYFYQDRIFESLLNFYAEKTSSDANFYNKIKSKKNSLRNVKFPIVYHERYNITAWGLEKKHSFDSQKYGKIMAILTENKILTSRDVHKPRDPSRKTLLQVHSKDYLAKLCESNSLARIVEVHMLTKIPAPILRWRLLEPMLLATQGSIDGGLLALERGWAINLSGGYHHASGNKGGGFCVYADITLCIKTLQRAFPDIIKKAMIIDLDAHQGNGHETDFLNDESVTIVDAYNHKIYPFDHKAKKAIKADIDVSYKDTDEDYLNKLKTFIPREIESFQPNFILYNAGTDCLAGDRLGSLNLSESCIIKRDEYIFELALKTYGIPVLMVLSGGYQIINARVIAESIINLGNKFDLWKHKKQS